MQYRIGIGYDIHRLVKGRKLILGGVHIPFYKGLLGYSDGDVLLHAICDALLGAVGEGDLGEYFPDTDPRYKGINSLIMLQKVSAFVSKRQFRINNIDTVIIAEAPRLGPFKSKIASKINQTLKLVNVNVNIKAKTNEGLGPIGKGQAISAYAVALLARKD